MKRVKLVKTLLPFFFLLFFLGSNPVLADEATFEVTKDTFGNSSTYLNYRDRNYGYAGSVVVSNDPIDRVGYFDFKNVELPAGSIIDHIYFRFYVQNAGSTGGIKLNVGPVAGDWEESSLTWNNKPTINQTLALEAEIGTDEEWKEIEVTSIINKWQDGSLAKKGLFV
ncbi:DNRLRE domain-containing protein, partial [Patescibacteria group bacterium]|nr:DNRLRE domain-containing protein [Patescibacteria group bacterium]